jgi:hypothetical protein
MRKLFRAMVVLAAAFAAGSVQAQAQSTGEHEQSASPSSISDSLRDLQAQVTELKSLVVEMRDEVARSRAETTELRRELEAARPPSTPAVPPADAQTVSPANEPAVEQRLAKLEEDQQLLSAKVDDQYQTKVESASKYRVRFSGIVLLNLFDNVGAVNNQDFPTLAEESGPLIPGGGFGGSLRQSQLSFEVFGPEVGGARTSADIQFDFAGGFPNAPNGVTFGLVRLRTGTIHLDWGRTSIIAGQDALFISPLAATSLASLAEPVLSYAGDLWSWAPQLRVEHRVDFSDTSNLLLQAGILYSLAGQPPASEYQSFPEAGESVYEYQLLAQLGDSRQPAYASRLAWTHPAFGKSFTLGGGGYYARQNWGFGRNVDAWASTADWTFAFAPRWELSGEFYRGRAVGGLGGGIGGSVTLSGPVADPSTVVRGLDSLGGWGQLKFRATEKLEFNGAFGQDNPFANQIRSASGGQQNYFNPWLARNQSWLVNFIYHPRSDLLFSAEYHYLRTFTTVSEPNSAQHINLSLGVLF